MQMLPYIVLLKVFSLTSFGSYKHVVKYVYIYLLLSFYMQL